MPNQTNVPITPPRVPLIDERTNTIAREWYRYFLSLFSLVGGSNRTLNDLQIDPISIVQEDIAPLFTLVSELQAQALPSTLEAQVAEIDKRLNALASVIPDALDLASRFQALEVTPPPSLDMESRFQALEVNPPAAMQVPWYGVLSQPHIEAYDNSASIALTSTPTLLKPASTAPGASGITYDATTGEFTFSDAGSYTLALGVNATASASNQFVYIYAENNTGAGWTVNTNSGKTYELVNANTVQIVYAQAIARVAGQKVRYWIYSNDGKVTLETVALPGSVGAVVPAIRIQYS